MAVKIFSIKAGSPITAVATTTLIAAGSTGDPTARRRLTHPTGGTFPPLIYGGGNPDRTFNFDEGNGELLRAPISQIVRTLDSTKLVRFEELTRDVIITELWLADGGLSMPSWFYRKLYEYLLNEPNNSAPVPEWITWEPRDAPGGKIFNVQLVRLLVGGEGAIDFTDVRAWGGPNDPFGNTGTILTPADLEDVTPTGYVDRDVALIFRIVEDITP